MPKPPARKPSKGALSSVNDSAYGVYSAPVAPGMSCRAAAVSILSTLMERMGMNAGGVASGSDMESLHDYRVAVRRIRAALSQIKGVFPEKDALRFKRDFRLIGRLTGELRDLDVLLLSKDRCEAAVPEELRPGLEAFFDEMASRREKEFRLLSSALSGQAHFKTVKRWQDYLASSDRLPETESSAAPVESLAGRFIIKRLKRIAESAGSLDEESSDSEMHALRIECKKLRYLLEFFGPLYGRRAVSHVVASLKGLQDFLGELNDLSVQRRLLSASLSKLPRKGAKPLLAAAALGALIARLCERRSKLKRGFRKVFSKFHGSEQLRALSKALR